MASWTAFHAEESKKDYFKTLESKLNYLYSEELEFFGGTHPPRDLIYRAFKETPLDKVRVVILGQDPYHGPKQANGLAFAVNAGVPLPPSLKNIVQESGCTDTTLVKWAQQGVLLLNTTLTVKHSKPMSCQGIWEIYTDNAIKYLLDHTEGDTPLIFCLWGKVAQSKKSLIEGYEDIVILEASHPSPLSAYISFIGCGHFTKINEILEKAGQPIIIW